MLKAFLLSFYIFYPIYTLWREICARLKPRKTEVIKGGGHVVMHELHEEINILMAGLVGLRS
jgi:hypothetical protein